MDIAVLTLATSDIASYSTLSFENKLSYVRLHGYDFYHYTSVLDPIRPPAWSKIRVIQRHLSFYDWVFWTDADSLIMNQSIALQDILSRANSHNMILTPGPRDKYNTGQWLVRSSDWSAAILEQIWDEVTPSDAWYWRNPWEQRALTRLVERTPEIADGICVLSMREMNSRPTAPYIDICPDLTGLEYEQGDFIVHFYHTKDAALRAKGMTQYYKDWMHTCAHAKRQEVDGDVDRFNGGYKWTPRKSANGSR